MSHPLRFIRSHASDMHVSRLWLVLLRFNIVTILAIAALMLLSLPLGIYLSSNSITTNAIGYFIASGIYMILFVMLILKEDNIARVSSDIIKGSKSNYTRIMDRNLLIVTVTWFSILLLASRGIDTLQNTFGISMGSLHYDDHIAYLIDTSIAPLKEELAFRVILIGLPLYLLSKRSAPLVSLWHPYSRVDVKNNIVVVTIVVSALLFAISHVLFSTWEYGKVSQAMLGGVILGWLYYRYGLHTAIILHWAVNSMLLTYTLLPSMGDATSITYIIEPLTIINAILAIALILKDELSKWFKFMINIIFKG